jgi:hypothetical protein
MMSADDIVRASRLVAKLNEARRVQSQPMLAQEMFPIVYIDRTRSSRDLLDALGLTQEKAQTELAIFWADKLSQRIADLEEKLREMGVEP